MKRKNQTCLLFEQVPDGTHYKEGAYSWVDEGQAREYIDKGYASEFDPVKGEEDELPEAEPKDTLGDLPGASYFKQAGITDIEEVRALMADGDIKSVDGIGDSTQKKIQDYLGE